MQVFVGSELRLGSVEFRRVRIGIRVSVRIWVRDGMPIMEYGYGKNDCTATDSCALPM